MGACGSKNSPLLDDGPPIIPGIKPIEMVTTGSTFDDLVESNILEPEEIVDEFFPTEPEPINKQKEQKQQPQPALESQKGMNGTTTTTTTITAPLQLRSSSSPKTSSPTKSVATTPAAAKNPLATDKHVMAPYHASPPSSSSSSKKLGEGLAKLEVPVQTPRNTKKISPQEFFGEDDLKSMDFDLFDGPSFHGPPPSAKSLESSDSSIQEIALKDPDTPNHNNNNNKLQRSGASFHTNSTSSYEEIVIESDDDFEVESNIYEGASAGSYVEEVIDDQVYEAFVKAQEVSHGALTFEQFIHQQHGEETEKINTITPAVVEPPSLARMETQVDDQKPIDDDQQGQLEKEQVDIESTKADLSSLKVTTDDQSAIATEVTLQTDQEVTKPVSETTSLRPLSFLLDPKTPVSNKFKANGTFVGMELYVSKMLGESTNNADRFLVSPLASPSQYTSKKITAADVPISPLSQNGLGEKPAKRKSTTSKRSKTVDKKATKSKSHSHDDDNDNDNDGNHTKNNKLEGNNNKKSTRKISRKSKIEEDTDQSKEHRRHHRRKEESSSKEPAKKSVNTSKGKDSSRSLEKGKESSRSLNRGKESSRSLQKGKESSRSLTKGTESSRSLTKEKESSRSLNKGKDSSRSLDKGKKGKTHSSKKNEEATNRKRSSTSSKKILGDNNHSRKDFPSEGMAKKELASPLSKQDSRSNTIAAIAQEKPLNRRPSRKIKFQPRTSKIEDATMLVDHKSLECNRSDLVKKVETRRGRLDEVVGGSASDPQTTSIPETSESDESNEKARGKHKIRRKKNQEEKENLKDDTPRDGANKEKGKHKISSSGKRTTGNNGQNAKSSSRTSTKIKNSSK